MGRNEGSDRRKYYRIATDQLISFAEVDHPDQVAKAKDLSTGGIRFEVVGVEINMGDLLRISFNIGAQPVVATGRVVWAIDMDPITQEIGIQFQSLDNDIVQLLEREVGQSPEAVEFG